MSVKNEIILRPRFNFSVNYPSKIVINTFESKKEKTEFNITTLDGHVFIRLNEARKSYWSPQLHLEIESDSSSSSMIYGVFGPNPTVWTMFMFFHFIVATFFIGCCIWTYVNWSLKDDYSIQLFLSLLMVMLWFTLYFIGRLGKKSGTPQMYELHKFMRDTLRENKIHSK